MINLRWMNQALQDRREPALPATHITPDDLERSATAHTLRDLAQILPTVAPHVEHGALLDIGCGFGGLTLTIGEYLKIAEIHGVDVDGRAAQAASRRGVRAVEADISVDPLPHKDGSISLVTSFGMLDYLPSFDKCLFEIFRVLRPGGFCLVSLPNLASWHTRAMLLRGYQPRDVEVSAKWIVGVHPYYRSGNVTGHLHTVTTKGFCELMEHVGFHLVRLEGSAPRTTQNRGLSLAYVLDSLFSVRPTLARRFFYLGQKPHPTYT